MSDVVICEDIKVSDIADHIYITHVSINDLDAIIKTIVENIVDLNWINDLPPRLHKGFKAAAAPTIKYIKDICDNIKDAQEPKTPISKEEEKQRTQIRKDFGEYAISVSALHALESLYAHRTIPLMEIIKEKYRGNHGFDYISISPSIFFVFGEAKYRKDGSGAKAAAEQIVKFIKKGQPFKDSNFIDAFDPFAPARCSEDDVYGISIAANLSQKTLNEHLQTLLKNKNFQKLLGRDAIYLIFVENEGIF